MPERIAKTVNDIQRYLVTQTRLKIAAIFHNEALNGVVAPYFIGFSTPMGSDDLGSRGRGRDGSNPTASVAVRRLLQALPPVMDVSRDARWGRVHKTFGEDPYLVSTMSVAFTRGMQGDDLRQGVLATAKHFLGYAVTEARPEHRGDRSRPTRAPRCLRPSVRGSHPARWAWMVMASYSEFDGVTDSCLTRGVDPIAGGRLGFNGTVVSDYVGVGWAQTRQRVATAEEVGS